MKKKYVTFIQNGKPKKAILDENLYRRYSQDGTLENFQEYDNEILMEKAFAQQVSSGTNKKMLYD